MINERARSLARKPRKKKVELQGTTASWSSVGVISCTRLLCIVLCWVEWRNWPVVLLMMIMMMIKVLRWSLLLQQCDQPAAAAAAACVVIICVSEVAASVWHTLQRPISCLRDTGGKGREGKGREVGKGREGRDFPVCRQSTTLSADSRGANGRRHLCCRLMNVHPFVFPLLHPPFQLLLPRGVVTRVSFFIFFISRIWRN